MISDVLADAISEIRRYQTDLAFAPCYEDEKLRARIDAVVEAMDALRAELDTPPPVASFSERT